MNRRNVIIGIASVGLTTLSAASVGAMPKSGHPPCAWCGDDNQDPPANNPPVIVDPGDDVTVIRKHRRHRRRRHHRRN